MEMLKTKEISSLLGVSQTTIRRWIALLPSAPMRDSLGGYQFSAADLDQLRIIQQQVEAGKNLSEVQLQPAEPSVAPLEPLPSSPISEDISHTSDLLCAVATVEAKTANLAAETNQLVSRMNRLEHALAQKADEVVSVQLLQHREELEEIRKSVSQLAASIEQLRLPMQMAAAARETAAPLPDKQRPRKRNLLFRFLF